MSQAVRDAIGSLDRPGLAGVVLDDLPIPLGEPLRHWVRALAAEAARLELRLVVTSERGPLAPVGGDLAPWGIDAIEAPYLTVAEVSEIVAAAGGDPGDWAQVVHLTCGFGHPLFVDARVAGLASRGWPKGERLSGLLDAGGVAKLEEVRTTVTLRLLNELDADAHTLLLRLSVLAGQFDRELAMAVAEAHRPLARPGALVEFLLGPWIEGRSGGRMKLSPLLSSAEATGLGDAERDAVRAAVVDHLVARRPLHADFLTQLLLQSLAARNMRGLMFVAGAVLTSGNRGAVARACIPLPFLSSGKSGRLVPEHPGISASLRLAQVIAVTAEPDHTALESVLDAADAEFATLPKPIRSGSRFTMLLAVLAAEALDIAPGVWMPRLLEYVAMTEGGSVPAELLEGLGRPDLGGLAEDQFFFMLRSNRIADVARLDELFSLLDGVPAERRSSWLAAGPALIGGPPLFIQSAWSNQAMAGTLDAAAALGTRVGGATLAERFEERESDGRSCPVAALAVRGGQLAAAVDRRDLARFLELLPRFVATARWALEAKAAGRLDARGAPGAGDPADWTQMEAATARMASSELLAELLLDGDAGAARSAVDGLARLAPALAALIGPMRAGGDHVAAALGAIAWLLLPGVAEEASLLQVHFTLIQWLAAGSRPTLRLRVWRQVADAWRGLLDDEGTGDEPAASRLRETLERTARSSRTMPRPSGPGRRWPALRYPRRWRPSSTVSRRGAPEGGNAGRPTRDPVPSRRVYRVFAIEAVDPCGGIERGDLSRRPRDPAAARAARGGVPRGRPHPPRLGSPGRAAVARAVPAGRHPGDRAAPKRAPAPPGPSGHRRARVGARPRETHRPRRGGRPAAAPAHGGASPRSAPRPGVPRHPLRAGARDDGLARQQADRHARGGGVQGACRGGATRHCQCSTQPSRNAARTGD